MTTVIYGKKIAMGEAYIGDTRRAVTKIALYPMTVTQLKTLEKDGYQSIQVGFSAPKKHSRRKLGKNRELPFTEGIEKDTVISPQDVVSPGSVCLVQGTSKGKGFAGVVKRWNFSGGPRTHGQSDRLRAPGSIGQGTTPGRVHKGKKMAGRMGGDTVTVKNSVVVAVNPDNTVWITGPVPGARHSLVKLTVVAMQEDFKPLTYLSGGLPVITPEPVLESTPEESKE